MCQSVQLHPLLCWTPRQVVQGRGGAGFLLLLSQPHLKTLHHLQSLNQQGPLVELLSLMEYELERGHFFRRGGSTMSEGLDYDSCVSQPSSSTNVVSQDFFKTGIDMAASLFPPPSDVRMATSVATFSSFLSVAPSLESRGVLSSSGLVSRAMLGQPFWTFP